MMNNKIKTCTSQVFCYNVKHGFAYNRNMEVLI